MRKLSTNLVPTATGLRRPAGFLLAAVVLLACACAKFPANQSGFISKRLVFTLKLPGNGVIRPDYLYFVALRLSTDPNPQDSGPVPITTFGGNGFVAGNCTHYIVYNSSTTKFEIWQFDNVNLISRHPIGEALTGDVLTHGFTFTIDMNQLVAAVDVDSIKSVQANFLTMNQLALSQSGHAWDSLGDGRDISQDNKFLTFKPVSRPPITNTNTQLEPPDPDMRGGSDPDLDFNDWSIEIQIPQQ